MSKKSVPVQKGTIISNPPTSKQMPFKEKVTERLREMSEIRRAQTLDYVSPKKSK
jgi:hypothetical protein